MENYRDADMSWLSGKKAEHMSSYVEYAGYEFTTATDSTKTPAARPTLLREPMGLEDTFTFGKHKGKTLEHVAYTFPSYIQWVLDAKPVVLKQDALDYIQELGEH